MVFDQLPAPQKMHLARIHRQAADNPILDLAHALADPDLSFEAFEDRIAQAARETMTACIWPNASTAT